MLPREGKKNGFKVWSCLSNFSLAYTQWIPLLPVNNIREKEERRKRFSKYCQFGMALRFTPGGVGGGSVLPVNSSGEACVVCRYKSSINIHSSHKEYIHHKFTRKRLQFKIFRPPRLSFRLKQRDPSCSIALLFPNPLETLKETKTISNNQGPLVSQRVQGLRGQSGVS